LAVTKSANRAAILRKTFTELRRKEKSKKKATTVVNTLKGKKRHRTQNVIGRPAESTTENNSTRKKAKGTKNQPGATGKVFWGLGVSRK